MNPNKIEIIPGILEQSWSEIEKKLNLVKTFSKSAHIDFIDGKFADNKTFLELKPFKKYSEDLFLEAHLMVEDPASYLDELSQNGFKRFLGHVEKMGNITDFVAKAQLLGEAGLALDGPTNTIALDEINLDDLDCILIYTSDKVGHSGPPFMPERLEKIKSLRAKSDISIEADGGIKDNTIQKARDAGATRFVATSFIWESENPRKAYENLCKLA